MKGLETKDSIELIYRILHNAKESTPKHIRGVIIPEESYGILLQRLKWICKDALLSKEYFKQINDTRIESAKATHNFMTTFCNKIADGTLILKH